MAPVTFALLENGLDSAHYALEKLVGTPGKRDLKHAVLFLSSAVELVFKERLRREDWKLLFVDPKSADEKMYLDGSFKSIGFDDALKRLRKTCGITIAGADAAALRVLKQKRNRLEHLGIVDTVAAVTATAAKTLGILLEFISAHLDPESFEPDDEAVLDEIRARTGEFKAYVSHRMNDIAADLKSAYGLSTCPSCLQDALTLGDGDPRCRFCGYKGDGEAAAKRFVEEVLHVSEYRAMKHGGESPRRQCPECGADALVLDSRGTGGQYENPQEAVCMACGSSWSEGRLTQCDCCGELFDSRDGELSTCRDCYSAKMDKDD